MDSSDSAGWHFLHMICFIFYSVRTLIHQQSPKLVLTDSNMGLMLIASANLITKIQLMSCVYNNPAIFLCTASGQN